MFRAIPGRLACAGAVFAAFAFAPGVAQAATTQEIIDSISDGADYAQTQQATDGNFDGFGNNLVPGALAAAGRNAADVKTGAADAVSSQDYLDSAFSAAPFAAPTDPATDANSRVGIFEQGILVGYAAGFDPARVSASQNLVAGLAGYYRDGYFSIAPTAANPERRSLNQLVFGALALGRTKAPEFLRDRLVRSIRDNQHGDGGWNFPLSLTAAAKVGGSDVDTTGATIAALCEFGVNSGDPAVRQGVGFLKTTLRPDGGFDPGYGTNVSSNAWAVSGLNACGIDPQSATFTTSAGNTPVDYLISQQNTTDGGFTSPFNDPVGSSDVYSTQDALRALAGESFSAEPPARVNVADPRRRTVPTVPAGTTVPISLAVDNDAGGVTFCRVSVPTGSTLAQVLATAAGASSPSGCATGAAFTAGQLTQLNGQTGTWAISVDRAAEQVAGSQTVGFGDFVALRRTAAAAPTPPAVPSTPAGTPAVPSTPVSAAVQARSTPTAVASKSLKASGRKRVVSVSLRCAKANRLCQGTVYLVYKRRTLARRAFLIRGNKTTRLNVKLSKAAAKRVGKSKRIKVNVFSRDGNGIATTSTRTVTLRISK